MRMRTRTRTRTRNRIRIRRMSDCDCRVSRRLRPADSTDSTDTDTDMLSNARSRCTLRLLTLSQSAARATSTCIPRPPLPLWSWQRSAVGASASASADFIWRSAATSSGGGLRRAVEQCTPPARRCSAFKVRARREAPRRAARKLINELIIASPLAERRARQCAASGCGARVRRGGATVTCARCTGGERRDHQPACSLG